MFQNFINLYFKKTQLIIFLMGILSGIPLYLILSTLFIWLTREGIDISTIGLFALTQVPWTIKFLWAPIFDNYKIPFFHQKIGQRKSWLLLIQIFLILSIISLGYSEPLNNIKFTALLTLLVVFFSASQDIVIDAYRIEILDDNSQGAGAAMTQLGYRIGGIFSGAGSLYLKTLFSWEIVFSIIAIIVFLLMILTNLFVPLKKDKKFIINQKNLI